MKERLPRLTVEHLRYSGIYVDDPDFLVVLKQGDQEAEIFGGYIIDYETAAEAILFRATQLLECSMVDPILETCTADFYSEFGRVHFIYDRHNFSYHAGDTTADKRTP